jgi:DNA-directed RNA polymerase subunit RPC12/RpoP
MAREYAYVGPKELLSLAAAGIPRSRLNPSVDARELHRVLDLGAVDSGSLTLTFIVDVDGVLWVADRHSEHVACARGRNVLAAGELTVADGPDGLEAIAATNQSTGYCPEPESWEALSKALHCAAIPHPERFEYEFEFRRCTECGTTVLVKDGILECTECGAQLSDAWNFENSIG